MKQLIKSTVFWFAVFILLLQFFGTCVIDGTSMEPTLHDGDFCIVRRHVDVERGDIVAIYSNTYESYLCKRVIGVAGDVIRLSDSKCEVNGVAISEPYLLDRYWGGELREITVGDNEVFVMGDNRNDSADSRILGCLREDNIYGVFLYNVTEHTGIHLQDLSNVLLVMAGVALFSYVLIEILMYRGRYKNG